MNVYVLFLTFFFFSVKKEEFLVFVILLDPCLTSIVLIVAFQLDC